MLEFKREVLQICSKRKMQRFKIKHLKWKHTLNSRLMVPIPVQRRVQSFYGLFSPI